MNSYHSFHLDLLKQTYNQLLSYSPFSNAELMTQEQNFLESFLTLIEQTTEENTHYVELGQHFAISWIRSYPDLTPVLPRDLLWFFGGDCLHYMPDEEIQKFQQLDEMRYEAESHNKSFNYAKERATLFNLLH